MNERQSRPHLDGKGRLFVGAAVLGILAGTLACANTPAPIVSTSTPEATTTTVPTPALKLTPAIDSQINYEYVSPKDILNWQSYPTLNEVYTAMDNFAKMHRDAKITDIGKTVENRPIKVLSFCQGNQSLNIMCDIHAREVSTTLMCQLLAEKLIAEPNLNTKINIVWVANPDGHYRVMDLGIIGWRKNAAKTGASCRINPIDGADGHDGVNLALGWRLAMDQTNDSQCNINYHPKATPQSQPETQALYRFFTDSLKNGGAFIDLHGNAHAIYGTDDAKKQLSTLARNMEYKFFNMEIDMPSDYSVRAIYGFGKKNNLPIQSLMVELPKQPDTHFFPDPKYVREQMFLPVFNFIKELISIQNQK